MVDLHNLYEVSLLWVSWSSLKPEGMARSSHEIHCYAMDGDICEASVELGSLPEAALGMSNLWRTKGNILGWNKSGCWSC